MKENTVLHGGAQRLPVRQANGIEPPQKVSRYVLAAGDRCTRHVHTGKAETWLIVAAAGEVGAGTDSWYSLVHETMQKAGASDLAPDGRPWPFGAGSRYSFGTWPPVAPRRAVSTGADTTILPDWIARPALAPAAVPKAISPSGLGGAKAIAGDVGQDEETAKRRGTILHGLLEHLPLSPPSDHRSIAWPPCFSPMTRSWPMLL